MDEFPVASGKLPVKGSLATTATFCQRLPELAGLRPGELFASSATPDCWNSMRVPLQPDCRNSTRVPLHAIVGTLREFRYTPFVINVNSKDKA